MKRTSTSGPENPANCLSDAEQRIAPVDLYSGGASFLNSGRVNHEKAQNEAHDQTQNAYHDGYLAQPPFAPREPEDAD